ncbi:MAG: hypothetical protein V4724_26820 [Pseudomonadota bacterium]
MDKLIKYLNDLPKADQVAFAIACKTTIGYLRKAASAGQLLHTTTCVLIERESGAQVTRKDLHPDDWEAHWPELAEQPHRRATDPTPAPAHGGRQPASPARILDTIPPGAVVAPQSTERKA